MPEELIECEAYELEPEVENELNNKGKKNCYFVSQTEIFCDEAKHSILKTFEDKQEAIDFARKRISGITFDNFKQVNDSFYGDNGSIVYIVCVCELGVSPRKTEINEII